MPLHRVPLAWRNLTYDKNRLALCTAGVAFAVLLILLQLSFRNALLESQVEVLRQLNCDLALLSATKYRLLTRDPFPRRRLFQAMAHPGVAAAYPLYIQPDAGSWKNPVDRTLHPIRVLAFNPDEPVFLNPDIDRHLPDLKVLDEVLLDVKSRPLFGPMQAGIQTELSGRKVRVAGMFELGSDFAVDGNLVTSERTFAELFPGKPGVAILEQVDIGLLKLAPGSAPEDVRRSLESMLPPDVQVVTKSQMIGVEWNYWLINSPVGAVFNLGTAVGFIVGVVICYQILFTDLSEYLPQFATLKAMGHGNGRLVRVVLGQAFYLSLLGYFPAALIGHLICRSVATFSGLNTQLTMPLLAVVLVLALIMCIFSGVMAVRKVITADPAEVF
jgi:putative ABC transport system permease protein